MAELIWKETSDFDFFSRELWDGLAKHHLSPFSSWSFWNALFESGSVGPEKSWEPIFFYLEENDEILALAPWFLRGHSWGDFVFDQNLAQALMQAGIPYYPKMLSMAPFTPSSFFPVIGRKDPPVLENLLKAVHNYGAKKGVGSYQLGFQEPGKSQFFLQENFLPWAHQEYRWINPGYGSFEDFLSSLKKNHRRSIFKERKKLSESGYTSMVIPANEAGFDWPKLMERLYLKTNDQFGPFAAKFLESGFFDSLKNHQSEEVYLSLGFSPSDKINPVAMAFLMRKGDLVAGRYWGSEDHQKFLHFEVCYYAVMDWCIKENIKEFDPGMGSHHKASRGFVSRLGWSLHQFPFSGVNRAFSDATQEWNEFARQDCKALNDRLPFKDMSPRDLKSLVWNQRV